MCLVDGCEALPKRRGMCYMHYKRWLRHGDPTAGRVPNGEHVAYLHNVVMNYEGDECLPWPYVRDEQGYGRVHYEGEPAKLVHRIVCKLAHGDPPDNIRRDALHKCGNGHEGCCNKHHVKWGTHSENMFDRWRDHRKRKLIK